MRMKRFYEYLIITSIVWGWYAATLPLWLHYAIGMSWNQIILWWEQGTVIELVLAYPLGKILLRVVPKVKSFLEARA